MKINRRLWPFGLAALIAACGSQTSGSSSPVPTTAAYAPTPGSPAPPNVVGDTLSQASASFQAVPSQGFVPSVVVDATLTGAPGTILREVGGPASAPWDISLYVNSRTPAGEYPAHCPSGFAYTPKADGSGGNCAP